MAPKPRVEIRDGELVASGTPVPRRSARADWLRTARKFTDKLAIARALRRVLPEPAPGPRTDSGAPPGAQVALRVFEELDALCRARGQALILVYLPVRRELKSRPQPAAAWLAARFGPLSTSEKRALFLPDGHYAAATNRQVAQELLPHLHRLFCSSTDAGCADFDAGDRAASDAGCPSAPGSRSCTSR